MDTATRIKTFLAPHLGGRQVGEDEDIFALGYVNSLFAMQLVAFVEKEFGFTVESEDLEFDNFRTVAGIARFVEAKAATSV
jgi:methoxymalonate biosynthesis acyl carrier protein